MRVLNVNSLVDPVTGGGTAERTLQISRALLDSGSDCSILTTDIGIENGVLPRFDGLKIKACECLLQRFYIPKISFSTVKSEVESADVIHIMGHWSVLNALVYLAARIADKPYVVCPAGALPIFGRSTFLKKIYNWIIGRRIIRNANAWIAITAEECSQFAAYGVDPNSVVVIPNGINPDDFPETDLIEFRKKNGLGNYPILLFLGRLNLIKGPDILLEAFCRGKDRWPEWRLVFAGPDGGLLESLKKEVEIRKVQDRVHFIGYVGGDEKSSAYHSAQLLAIPSRQEAMSIVVLEAGISGIPVLLTDQCGFDQVEQIGGGVVTSATVEGVYSGLEKLLNDNTNLGVMGIKLKGFVKDHYTWRVVILKYLNLYSELLRKR